MSPGDIIDEFAGNILHNPPQGKVTCSAIVVVKHVLIF